MKEFEKYLETRVGYARHDQLGNMARALELLGHPERNIRTIHLAGTNGKGSAAKFLNNILIEAGLRVGLYTSPHMMEINERIRLDNKNIEDHRMEAYLEELGPLIEKLDGQGINLRYFELLTLIAILYFRDERVDVAIMEAGVGGLYDATNIMDRKILSLLMNIGYDHMNVLGDSLEEIALNKAGIIDQKALIYPMDERPLNVLIDYCRQRNIDYFLLDRKDLSMEKAGDGYSFSWKNYRDISLSSPAPYQVYNAAMALMAADYLRENKVFDLSEENIRRGLESFTWPGRMELISDQPRIILDGAHNELGIKVLVDSLAGMSYKKLIVIVGNLEDKDYQVMAKNLQSLEASFILTDVAYGKRSLDSDVLGQFYGRSLVIRDNRKALEKALDLYEEGDLILVTGSLYLIADFRKIILDKKASN